MIDKGLDKEVERVRKLAKVLDSQFEIPGLGFKVGFDPIIGLVPVVGDLVANILGAYPIRVALAHNLPRPIILQMIINLLVDYLLGSIPLLGDIFDIVFKANQRNLRLLIAGLDAPKTQQRHSIFFILLVGFILLLIITAPLILLVVLINSLG